MKPIRRCNRKVVYDPSAALAANSHDKDRCPRMRSATENENTVPQVFHITGCAAEGGWLSDVTARCAWTRGQSGLVVLLHRLVVVCRVSVAVLGMFLRVNLRQDRAVNPCASLEQLFET